MHVYSLANISFISVTFDGFSEGQKKHKAEGREYHIGQKAQDYKTQMIRTNNRGQNVSKEGK